MPKLLAFLIVAVALSVSASADSQLIDNGESTNNWSVSSAVGVEAGLSIVEGRNGKALRVDYNFKAGGGYWVLRRDLGAALPDNYDFSVDLRGEGLPNNLEFKLCDPPNENVWWVWRGSWVIPTGWTELHNKRRNFKFAWGPSGGKPLETIGGVEIAMSAAKGGRGYLLVDNLRFEKLEPPEAVTHTPLIAVSSSDSSATPAKELGDHGHVGWRSRDDDANPTLTLDFQQIRSFGGVRLDFAADATPPEYEIQVSSDGEHWKNAAGLGRAPASHFVALPDTDARGLRVIAPTAPVGIDRIELLPLEFGDGLNARFAEIAKQMPVGEYPRQFLNKQTFWTIVGVPEDTAETLLDETGMLEGCAGRWSICPVLNDGDRKLTWAAATRDCSLERGDLPIPSAELAFDNGLRLRVTALASGDPGASRVLAHYALTNTGSAPWSGALELRFRPFQVLPPWQNLNRVGGAGRIDSFSANGDQFVIDGRTIVSSAAPATTMPAGEMERSGQPGDSLITGGGTWRVEGLDPGKRFEVTLAIPLHDATPEIQSRDIDYDATLSRETRRWADLLDRVEIHLPAADGALARTFRTTQAYIMINADGPAIQPGSRTYERSWIRDGAMTATALLYTGHPKRARDFLEWYAPYQFENGMIPAIVDHRGPDPIPEHDSTGEFIHLLLRYYQFTGDRDMLQRLFPTVARGVAYLDQLRHKRMTGPYVDGTDIQKACYGLVTESISHEGYSPPRHSYWDGFWILRGLQDAREIASILGKTDDAASFGTFYEDYRRCMLESIDKARKIFKVEYIPGCVELGDFDATSTAIAIFPCAQAPYLPQDALKATFDRYMKFFRDRRDGRIEWEGYTPYEIRSVGALVLMGRVDEAHELLDFFMTQQRPAGWNHWAEVVYRDPDTPKYIGDMPHTWVGSGFMNSLRMMLVYERERDQALILGLGVPRPWRLDEQGVSVANLATMFGDVAYRLHRVADHVVFETGGCPKAPGGVWLSVPEDVENLRVNGSARPAPTNGLLPLPDTGPVTVEWNAN
ncbi:MAG: discoidin domain-containing protein [Phycisphaerales bacterium]|nr:discoidin domain-containing protein [Phycisphaerales bacterium]